MRVLVACPSCQRQFDASGRAPGDHFRCSCGETLTVPAPRGHDAAVVRCSSCGAPREEGAGACSFCGADFTLHERDLHTICPGCFARVSDRARFCHHCALPLVPQGTAGEVTGHTCPACGDGAVLASRGLGGRGISVLECGRCAGLWLGPEVFHLLEEEARQVGAAAQEASPADPPTPTSATTGPQQGPLYRPCAFCGRLMHRRNYGRKSGVIVDQCREHGMWFDAGELERVLDWVRRGSHARAERLAAEEKRRAERSKEIQRRFEPAATDPFGEREGWSWNGGWRILDVVDFVADIIHHLRR